MLFITFEGIEGSGKTTALSFLEQKLLNDDNIKIIVTREPGGSLISEEIRKIILSKDNKSMDFWTEMLLFIAARRQHLVEKVWPEKDSKKIIICDRFSDSTLAYQGYGRKLDIKKINLIQDTIFNGFNPDLTIFFDVKPEIGLERIRKRDQYRNNRLDEETLNFHNLVYQGYKEIYQKNKNRIQIVNANKKIEEVLEEIYKIVKMFIKEHYK